MNRKGFTLIEMLTVLAIMAIIYAFSIPFFSNFSKGMRMNTASREVSSFLRMSRGYIITNRCNAGVKETPVIIDLDNNRYWLEDDGKEVDKKFVLPQTISFLNVEIKLGEDVTVYTSGNVSIWFTSVGSCVDSSGNLVWVYITLKSVTEERKLKIIPTTGIVRRI